MSENNPNNDWMNDKEKPKTDPNEKYERFYYIWKRRIHSGWEPSHASNDAPPGFQKWLKSKDRMIK